MLTGLPREATARMKLVCRQRNAGVCRTSTTAATSASGVSSCTSVSTCTPMLRRTPSRIFRPCSIPSPRKLPREERFALSKDALNTKGMPRRPVISFRRPATCCVSSALSMTQGPAMRKNGRSMPISCPTSFMGSRASGLWQQRCPLRPRGADEAGEERVAVARGRGELRMELRRHEPGVAGDLDDFHQAVAREAGEAHAGLAVAVEEVVVELVTVAVALEDGVLGEGLPGAGAGREQHLLRAQAHGAALARGFVPRLRAARLVLPLADERDHRMRRRAVEFRAVGSGESEHV